MRSRAAHFRDLDRRHHIREVVRELPGAAARYAAIALLSAISVLITLSVIALVPIVWSRLESTEVPLGTLLIWCPVTFGAVYICSRWIRDFCIGFRRGIKWTK